MEEKNKVLLLGISVVVLVALVIVLYYFFILDRGEGPPTADEVVEQAEPQVMEEEEKAPEEEVIEPLEVNLRESDPVIRDLIKGITSSPRVANWARTNDLILKFVAGMDNIANGQSPRAQVDFFTLPEGFQAVEQNGRTVIDPASYDRYTSVAEAFDSLDTKGTIRLYKQLKPVIQEAYKDLGYPDTDFNDTLTRAIVELLRVPVVKDILLEKKIISYAMVDPELEGLSQAQKHLLRMGPENILRIQSKLREMAQALGIASSRLPR
jgi:flagellar basal body-associated protein FliL